MATRDYVIVHTAAHDSDTSAETIRRWHVDGNGWRDIGYHLVIRKDGTLEYGRPYDHNGAHCVDMGMNSRSIGVCFSGHGDLYDFTEEQKRAFAPWYYQVAYCKYDIPWRHVWGHRETGANKSCPGTQVDMDRLRRTLQIRYFGTL